MRRSHTRLLVGLALGSGLIAWLASGFYSLSSGDEALILRWGRVIARQTEPGVHFHLPYPIDRVTRARVSEVHSLELQTRAEGRELITGDANLVMVSAIASYDIYDLDRSRFGVTDLDRMLQAIGQESLCRELAAISVDVAMTGGQSLLRQTVRDSVQRVADRLDLGVRIISVELASVSPPETVSEAFQLVASARSQKQEIVQDAHGYAGSVVPRARGEARAIVSAAEADATEELERARSDSVAFARLAAEYHRSPEITRHLQWLNALTAIFDRSQVRLDPDPARSIYYLRDVEGAAQESTPRRRISPPKPQARTEERDENE